MITRLFYLSLLLQNISPTFAKSDIKWISPQYNYFFQFPLSIPPAIKPLTSYNDSGTNTTIDFFLLNISAFQTQIYPNLGKADLVGYNGISPGPTFRIQRGRQTVVRVVNQNVRPSVLHLHGAYTRPVWDGWAEDLIQTGQFKDYYFANENTARTLWYHDHAVMITSVNAYSGLAGFYIIEDPEVEARLGLPQGNYDVPLALSSKEYTSSGNLTWVGNETDSVYGDVIEVNGQPWPFLRVEPRKYRLRILNTALSRTFVLGLASSDGSKSLAFQVIASDSGFMNAAVITTELTVAMAERWEVVVDFSEHSNQNITLTNQRKVFDSKDYAGTDRVMQFNVGPTVSSDINNGPVPTSLVTLDTPPATAQVHRTFKFDKEHDTWLINGVPFDDVKNRVLASPQKGSTEIWVLENKSDFWSHPIHIHMVDFQILSRSGGRNTVEPFEKAALKDVAVLGPNEQVTIAVTFAPFAGLYMFHCHNLIHEDHAMMDAFNVTDAQGLGYSASDLSFADPMEAQWRASGYNGTDVVSILKDLLPQFAATNAYQNVSVESVPSDGTSDAVSCSVTMHSLWLALFSATLYHHLV